MDAIVASYGRILLCNLRQIPHSKLAFPLSKIHNLPSSVLAILSVQIAAFMIQLLISKNDEVHYDI